MFAKLDEMVLFLFFLLFYFSVGRLMVLPSALTKWDFVCEWMVCSPILFRLHPNGLNLVWMLPFRRSLMIRKRRINRSANYLCRVAHESEISHIAYSSNSSLYKSSEFFRFCFMAFQFAVVVADFSRMKPIFTLCKLNYDRHFPETDNVVRLATALMICTRKERKQWELIIVSFSDCDERRNKTNSIFGETEDAQQHAQFSCQICLSSIHEKAHSIALLHFCFWNFPTRLRRTKDR